MKKFFYTLVAAFILFSCRKHDSGNITDGSTPLLLDSIRVISVNIPSDDYSDVVFVDETTGFAVSSGGRIIKTTDAGNNWSLLASFPGTIFRKIQFTDTLTGYAMAIKNYDGFVYKTTDAGQTWVQAGSFPNEGLTGMYFIDCYTGFITGGSLFLKTINGGQTWVNVAAGEFSDVNFKNKYEGIATAANGIYYITGDGGDSWNRIQTKRNVKYDRVYYAGPRTLFSASNTQNIYDIENDLDIILNPLQGSKLFFLDSRQSIGIGQHWETGFFPYGDILVTNDRWKTFAQQTHRDTYKIGAIGKLNDRKFILFGARHSGAPTKVLMLYR